MVIADREKIKNLFDEAMQVMRDCDDLKESLADTVKAIAEEMDIKPAHLNKALKIAYKQVNGKGTFDDAQDELNMIEQILLASGKLKALGDSAEGDDE